MADHSELMGAPMVDVGPSIDAALAAWERNVQPRVKQVVRTLSAPKEFVEDTHAWVKAKTPAARRVRSRARGAKGLRRLIRLGACVVRTGARITRCRTTRATWCSPSRWGRREASCARCKGARKTCAPPQRPRARSPLTPARSN
jgi:hypothetical protein